MIESLFLAAALIQAAPPPDQGSPPADAAPATPAQLSAEDRARLRCAVAFSFVAARTGSAAAAPEIKTRGREFFVVTLADLMDSYQLDRPAMNQTVRAEAQSLAKAGETDAMMPACLLMLQSSGL